MASVVADTTTERPNGDRKKMMNFVNLTPHPITIRKDGIDTTFQPNGLVARVSEEANNVVGSVYGFPVLGKTRFGDVLDLPSPVEGSIFIVSGMVAANIARSDVYSPATGPKDEAIRNEKGHIVAVKYLKATV